MPEQLNIALTKGRLTEQLLPLLVSAGMEPATDMQQDRRLMIPSACERYRFLGLRGSDTATYVQLGAADAGVVGKDMLLEIEGAELYEMLDLEIGRCRLMTAGPVGQTPPARVRRVATKHPNTTRRYYQSRGIQAQIIGLYGSLEIAPAAGLADEIVDLVETGTTLANNGLEERELIADSSARLIVNKATMRLHHEAITTLCQQLAAAVAEARQNE